MGNLGTGALFIVKCFDVIIENIKLVNNSA